MGKCSCSIDILGSVGSKFIIPEFSALFSNKLGSKDGSMFKLLHYLLCFTSHFKQQTGNLSRYCNDLILEEGNLWVWGEVVIIYLNIILMSKLIYGNITENWCFE